MRKKFPCPHCPRSYTDLNALIDHIGSEHEFLIPKGFSIKHYLFNIRNGLSPTNKFGKSILSGKPTTFNEELGKYNRLVDDKEKEEYRSSR